MLKHLSILCSNAQAHASQRGEVVSTSRDAASAAAVSAEPSTTGMVVGDPPASVSKSDKTQLLTGAWPWGPWGQTAASAFLSTQAQLPPVTQAFTALMFVSSTLSAAQPDCDSESSVQPVLAKYCLVPDHGSNSNIREQVSLPAQLGVGSKGTSFIPVWGAISPPAWSQLALFSLFVPSGD